MRILQMGLALQLLSYSLGSNTPVFGATYSQWPGTLIKTEEDYAVSR
jgi:hypothetical protein